MPDPVFDEARSHSVRREMGKAVRLAQDGHLFDVHHNYVGVDDLYQPPKEPEVTPDKAPNLQDEGKSGVLRRAAAKLEGYGVPENLSENRKEDQKALQAEERFAG